MESKDQIYLKKLDLKKDFPDKIWLHASHLRRSYV